MLDIGCGLGDNAIFLASRGYSVTGLDGSPAAIEEARNRAAEAGVHGDASTSPTPPSSPATSGRFDTVIDSALYHCLDEEGRQSYAPALHRATRPGARWHLSCFSDGNVNGVIAPMGAVPEANIRDTLTAPGGASTSSAPPPIWPMQSDSSDEQFGKVMAEQMPPEAVKHMREVAARIAKIAELLDDGRVHLPFTVVHAHRVD